MGEGLREEFGGHVGNLRFWTRSNEYRRLPDRPSGVPQRGINKHILLYCGDEICLANGYTINKLTES